MNLIQIIKNEIIEGYKQTKWLPLLTAYAALSGIIGPGFHYPLIHVPFIILIIFVAFRSSLKISISSLLLLLYLPINILVTQPDKAFYPWMRLALLAIVFIFLSPMLGGQAIGFYRQKILKATLIICVLLGLGSFVCYFIGVNYMFNQYDGSAIFDYQASTGVFGGLTFQSISLGMICGLGILYLMYSALQHEGKSKKGYYLLIAVLAMTILISASRSAFLSVIMGVLVMLYQVNKKGGKFIKVLMGIILVLMLTYPLWDSFASGMMEKTISGSELGTYGSRTQKWTARMTEFSSNPVFGIGFASVDKNIDDVGAGGVVEPGSSWLTILSMTGIIGFLLFVVTLLKPCNYLKRHVSPYNALLSGLLAFITTHMISEGYIFAGGSSLCFISWLIFGCCNDAMYLQERK